MKKLAITGLVITTACMTQTVGLDPDGEPIPLASYNVSGSNIQARSSWIIQRMLL